MSGRRVLALYGALLLGFAAVVCRLYWLCSNTDYAVRAAAQSEAVLRLPAARGYFYDCDGLPLREPKTPQMVFTMQLPKPVPPLSFLRHAVELSAKA